LDGIYDFDVFQVVNPHVKTHHFSEFNGVAEELSNSFWRYSFYTTQLKHSWSVNMIFWHSHWNTVASQAVSSFRRLSLVVEQEKKHNQPPLEEKNSPKSFYILSRSPLLQSNRDTVRMIPSFFSLFHLFLFWNDVAFSIEVILFDPLFWFWYFQLLLYIRVTVYISEWLNSFWCPKSFISYLKIERHSSFVTMNIFLNFIIFQFSWWLIHF
jgi:hypothetical protein